METQLLRLCVICFPAMDSRVWSDCIPNFPWLIITFPTTPLLLHLNCQCRETTSSWSATHLNSSKIERIKLSPSLDEEGVQRSLEIGRQNKRMGGRSKETLCRSEVRSRDWSSGTSWSCGSRGSTADCRGEAWRASARGVARRQRKSWECQGGCKDTSQGPNEYNAM